MKIDRNSVVVVTGASGGVGRATIRRLGERGASVVLIARGPDGLAAAKREVEERGGRAVAISADVSRFQDVELAAQAAEREFGRIDLWINNAMVSMYSPFIEMTPEEFHHIVDVTFLGTVHGTRAALSRMIPANRGVIIQVGSALAFRSIPLQSAYCASKHAIQGFTESIRSELIHERSAVRVSIVNMPALNTTQFVWTKNRMRQQVRPTGTIFQPEVAADAILYAAEHERREVMVGYTTVQATLGEKIVPGLLDRYLATAAWEGALLPRAADPARPDNFWKPLPGDHGSHGQFDAMARNFSLQLWATKHRKALVSALFALTAAWATSRLARRPG